MVIYIAGSIPLFRGKRSNHFRLQRQSKHGAAHLYRDEETPHIHVTLVPIVKGERKRRKREEQTKKRYRKKPTDTVRLCADDIMTRKYVPWRKCFRSQQKDIRIYRRIWR